MKVLFDTSVLSKNELRGCIIYDAVIAHAGYKAKVDELFTLHYFTPRFYRYKKNNLRTKINDF